MDAVEDPPAVRVNLSALLAGTGGVTLAVLREGGERPHAGASRGAALRDVGGVVVEDRGHASEMCPLPSPAPPPPPLLRCRRSIAPEMSPSRTRRRRWRAIDTPLAEATTSGTDEPRGRSLLELPDEVLRRVLVASRAVGCAPRDLCATAATCRRMRDVVAAADDAWLAYAPTSFRLWRKHRQPRRLDVGEDHRAPSAERAVRAAVVTARALTSHHDRVVVRRVRVGDPVRHVVPLPASEAVVAHGATRGVMLSSDRAAVMTLRVTRGNRRDVCAPNGYRLKARVCPVDEGRYTKVAGVLEWAAEPQPVNEPAARAEAESARDWREYIVRSYDADAGLGGAPAATRVGGGDETTSVACMASIPGVGLVTAGRDRFGENVVLWRFTGGDVEAGAGETIHRQSANEVRRSPDEGGRAGAHDGATCVVHEHGHLIAVMASGSLRRWVATATGLYGGGLDVADVESSCSVSDAEMRFYVPSSDLSHAAYGFPDVRDDGRPFVDSVRAEMTVFDRAIAVTEVATRRGTRPVAVLASGDLIGVWNLTAPSRREDASRDPETSTVRRFAWSRRDDVSRYTSLSLAGSHVVAGSSRGAVFVWRLVEGLKAPLSTRGSDTCHRFTIRLSLVHRLGVIAGRSYRMDASPVTAVVAVPQLRPRPRSLKMWNVDGGNGRSPEISTEDIDENEVMDVALDDRVDDADDRDDCLDDEGERLRLVISGDERGRVRVWWVLSPLDNSLVARDGSEDEGPCSVDEQVPKCYSYPDPPLPGLNRLLHDIDGCGWHVGNRVRAMELVGTTLYVADDVGSLTAICLADVRHSSVSSDESSSMEVTDDEEKSEEEGEDGADMDVSYQCGSRRP